MAATAEGRERRIEWPTVALIAVCYLLWYVCLFRLAPISLFLAIPVMGIVAALHSSITHEVLHGHPFRSRRLNEVLVFLPLTLFFPYERFRDLHLAHHRDSNLTDPYDDPETNYMDPDVWAGLPRWMHLVLRFNNTMLGRITIGTAVGQAVFFRSEWRGFVAGDRAIRRAWVLHFVGLVPVLGVVALSQMPVWAYVVSAYIGLSLIKIRTFLEHRAHDKSRARTVIVEDRGPLAFLFLNNNLHVVHHMNPRAAWYELPAIYRAAKERYRAINDAYVYRSYAEIFRQFFFRAKDPVPHPLWPRD